MFAHTRISKVYHMAAEIPFTEYTKFVIMSDCHRGDGSYADDFAHNQNLFFAALTQYYHHKYTYIELGDGDELWENHRVSKLLSAYDNIFRLLSEFHKDGRLYMVYGNHDIVKGMNSSFQSRLVHCEDGGDGHCSPLFPGIRFHEGLILRHEKADLKLFLLHGHQADFLNHRLWWLSAFLVRFLWRPLELLGVNDPTSAAVNLKRRKATERKLMKWAEKEKQPLIAGHTHRAVFPKPGEVCYFNDGSCVHPRCITALEIADGSIGLVKWSYQTKFDGTVFVGRDLLTEPVNLKEFYSSLTSGA